MWRIAIRWYWCLAAFVAWTAATPAMADRGVVPLATCVASGDLPLATVMAPTFAGFRCDGRQQRFGPGDYWIRARALPVGAGTTLTRLRYGAQWQARVALYVRYADGRVVALPIPTGREGEAMRLGGMLEQRLPRAGVRVTALMWRIEGSANVRGIINGAALVTADAAAATDLSWGVLYAGFTGLCLALLFYNVALWVAVRHRFQLAYCAVVAALLCYGISASGALMWWWPSLANTDRLRISYLTLAASSAAAIWFARAFFEQRIFAGWLGRCATGVAIAILGTGLLLAALAPTAMPLLDRLHGATFAAQLLLTGPILWNAIRRRSRFTILFALTWAGSSVLAAIRVINTFHLLSSMLAINRYVVLLMAAEVLLSSLAIAYRIYLLGRERDEARTQEIAARFLADTDPLTGLMNRRSFLDQAIGREGPQQLLILDLDHFKTINETIGHDGGDEVLRIVARTLSRTLPPEALVARIGGEEFAIVAPAGSRVTAALIVGALRDQQMPYDLSVTTSIGICTGPLLREADWKQLYRQADRALYAAKAAGRDRVRDAGTLLLAA